MDINQACTTVEAFLDGYRVDHADWGATEIRVLPSGDDKDAIKIWINFGAAHEGEDLGARADRAISALKAAHADIAGAFQLSVRSDAM
jgi:hypothetical protein